MLNKTKKGLILRRQLYVDYNYNTLPSDQAKNLANEVRCTFGDGPKVTCSCGSKHSLNTLEAHAHRDPGRHTQPLWFCRICGKRSLSRDLLEYHILHKHQCDGCKEFTRSTCTDCE